MKGPASTDRRERRLHRARRLPARAQTGGRFRFASGFRPHALRPGRRSARRSAALGADVRRSALWHRHLCHRPPPTAHRPPPTNHQPPTTNHQPPTTNHRSARVIFAPDPSVRRCRARRVPRPPRSSRATPQYFVPDAVNAPDKRAAALSVAACRRGCSQSGQPGQPESRRGSVHGDPTRANRACCLHAERLGAQRSSVNRPSNAPRLRRGCARLARHAAFSRDLITLRLVRNGFPLLVTVPLSDSLVLSYKGKTTGGAIRRRRAARPERPRRP
ncbi:Uncharacterised protein [Burkholderia pseudomallei]|nr:Uncharacterised protein [Burkholderia pseudomallei]VBH20402.1 Uncharacterised protein [Burkholderia pseudomallei]VBK13516.1 Uncharacterised protein [Burkholderia pseudomallei]VBR19291.1 Uncharacterised protein [Burkholderia pseudomallei]VCB52237.1 Uncharacterised protein [Burkholderia pseudomallei]